MPRPAINSWPNLRFRRQMMATLDWLEANAAGGAAPSWAAVTGKPADFPPSAHSHVIADTTGLQAALDAKQVSGSYATAADLAAHAAAVDPHPGYLTTAEGIAAFQPIGAYAAAVHGHALGDVTGLQSALDGKQAAGSYAAAAHTHAIGDTTGLQAALDGKAASAHNHVSTDISDSTAAGRAMLTAVDAAAQSALLGGGSDVPFAYCQLTSNYTLTSTTAAQKLFNTTAAGALTLATGRYRFNALLYLLSMSGTSGNGAFHLLGAGTAVLANILYQAVGLDNTTPLVVGARGGSAAITQNSPAGMVTVGTGTGLVAQIDGIFNITTAGTIIPSIALLTAAAAVVQAGSFFECIRIGDTGANTKGTWS